VTLSPNALHCSTADDYNLTLNLSHKFLFVTSALKLFIGEVTKHGQ